MLGRSLARTVALVALLLVAAAPAQAATHTVTAVANGDSSSPFAFSPETLTIQVGDTVRWVNGEGTYHTTTSRGTDGDANGDLWQGVLGSKGTTYEHTFTEAGTFAYFCQPHATFMTAAILVEGDGINEIGGGTDDKGAPGFTPMTLLAALGVALLARRR
jgi:plastocyanin